MVNFGYPSYNDIVICKDSTDYLAFLIFTIISDKLKFYLLFNSHNCTAAKLSSFHLKKTLIYKHCTFSLLSIYKSQKN